MDPRTVELIVTFTGDESKSYTSGSGYLVTPSLVLTAGHLFDPGEDCGKLTAVEARPIFEKVLTTGSVCWRSDLADVALIRLDQGATMSAAAVPVRWGKLGGAGRVRCRAVGFPRARAHRRTVDGRPIRDPEPVEGDLAPGTAAKSRVSADVHVSGAVPLWSGDHDSLWSGLSGAVVFVGPWLVGVVVGQPASFGPNRLSIDLIEAVAAERGFVEQLGQLTLEAADLPRWLRPPYESLQARLRHSAQILRPKYRVIPFRPRIELEGLLAWCETDDPYAVKLLIADGGEGKTRLAAELSAVMFDRGWLAGFVDDTTLLDPQDAPIGQVLLVVDYADSRTERAMAAIRALRRLTAPARLLLLARHGGRWWDALPDGLESGGDLIAEQAPERLSSLVADYQNRQAEFTWAAKALATHLERAELPAPPPELKDHDYANLFLVQLAALTMIDPADGIPISRNLLDQALRREDQKHWLPLARQRGLTAYQGLEPRRREAAVAVPTLARPSTDDRAATLLGTQPEIQEESLSQRLTIVEWLQSAYPPDTPDNQGLGALEPDLIGEHLISRFITRSDGRDRLWKLAAAAAPEELSQMFIVLKRAGERSADVWPALQALSAEHGEYLIPLLEVDRVSLLTAGVGDLIELRAQFAKSSESITIAELAGLQAPARTILFGAAGSGKTTATLMLARTLLARREEDRSSPFPFIISVRELLTLHWDRADLLDVVADLWQDHFSVPVTRAIVDKVFRLVPAYVIFDGIGELPDSEQQYRIASRISALSERYPALSILVTNHPSTRSAIPLFDHWRRFEITPFRPGEVEQFLIHHARMAGDQRASFIRWLRQSPSLMRLLDKPSLLSMALELSQGRGAVPTRVRLLQEVVASERSRRRTQLPTSARQIPDEDWIRRILPGVALAAFVDREDPAYLEAQWLYATVEEQLQLSGFQNTEELARTLLNDVDNCRSLFLVPRQTEMYSGRYYFSDQIVFDYLVAWALCMSRASYEDIWDLVTARGADAVLSLVIEICLDDRYRAIGALHSFLDLAANSSDRDQALFAAAVGDVTNASPQADQAIRTFRDNLTRGTPSARSSLEGQLLSKALDRPARHHSY